MLASPVRAARAAAPRDARYAPRAPRPVAAHQRQARRTAACCAAAALDVAAFTLIVDDIVNPDGSTVMEALGGGGPQTCFGLLLHPSAPRVGLAAGVGADMPASCLRWLEAAGVDASGLLPLPGVPTPRAWQVLEHDGRRTQVWRSRSYLPSTLRPALAQLPQAFRHAAAYHLGVHPLLVDLGHLAQLRAAAEASPAAAAAPRGGLLSIEPYTAAERMLTGEELRAFCSAAHIVSPNEAEAISMVGPAPPAELVARFARAGAGIVALRRGPEGAIVHRADTGETWEVPVCAGIEAMDPTGCGNAFCGGFLASWRAGESLSDAGVWGCVAASFMLEVQAVPSQPPHALREKALARVAALRSRVKRLA